MSIKIDLSIKNRFFLILSFFEATSRFPKEVLESGSKELH